MNKSIFKKKATEILRHKTFANVGYLTVGNVLAQLFALVGVIYIPKLLGPENYGIYNTVTAYVGMFTVFTFSGLSKVIIREASKDVSKTKEILEATIGIRNLASVFATLLSISVVLFIDYEKGTQLYIVIYSFSLLFLGVESSINTIFQSHQQMKILGVIAAAYQFIKVPLAIFFLYLGYGVISLLLIELFLHLTKASFLYYYSKRIISFNFFEEIKLVKEYMYSGTRFTMLSFLNILSTRIDLVMLSFLTTPANVGIYALAYRFVNKGLVLRTPISQSLFPYYSEKFEKKKPQIRTLLMHIALIAIPLTIFLIPSFFIIEPLIKNIIGTEFIESAEIFKVLVFYLVFNFCVIPFGLFLQATNNENLVLNTVAVTAVLNIILNILFFQFFGIIGIAYSTLLVQLISFIQQFIYSIIKIKRN